MNLTNERLRELMDRQVSPTIDDVLEMARAMLAVRELCDEHYHDFDDEHGDLVRKLRAIVGAEDGR